jgi:hypothetical protein
MSYDNTIAHLDKALANSTFDLGEYLDDGFNIWKKRAFSFVGIFIVTMVCQKTLGYLPVIGPILYSFVVAPCITLGIFLGTQVIDDRDIDFRFDDFFSGFPLFTKLIVLYSIISLLAILIVTPLMLHIGVGNLEAFDVADPTTFPVDSLSWTTILLMLPILYAALLVSYAIPMLGFYQLPPFKALTYSAKFIHKHWFKFFAFSLVVGFIVLLGLLAFIIGVVITGSMIYPMIYASFKDVTDLNGYLGTDEEEETDIIEGGITLDDFR